LSIATTYCVSASVVGRGVGGSECRSRLFGFHCSAGPRELRSFPTRRSSDLSREVSPGPPLRRDSRVSTRHVRRRSAARSGGVARSEEHTSELQSRGHLVCRLLREKQHSTADSSRCRSCASPLTRMSTLLNSS